MTYRLLSSLQQATPLLSETPVFREFISYQSGLSRPALPKLRHLLTKHRQCQQTPLAIIRCFLNFSSPHTPAFTPDSNHPAAATPTEWQPAPATRVTLLLPGREYHRDQECLKSIANQPATQSSTTHRKTPTLRALSHSQRRKTAKHNSPTMRISFIHSKKRRATWAYYFLSKPTRTRAHIHNHTSSPHNNAFCSAKKQPFD